MSRVNLEFQPLRLRTAQTFLPADLMTNCSLSAKPWFADVNSCLHELCPNALHE